MNVRGQARRLSLSLVYLLALVSLASAAESTWNTSRTTVPGSLEDLKALENRVRVTIEKSSPWTVGLLVRDGGKTAAGSGVIVNDDGLILTAGHVSAEPGKSCTIILSDGKRAKGKTLGRNDRIDSGMIQITDKGPNNGKWPHATIAKSSELKDGQYVITLGHPGGYRDDRPPVARLGRVLFQDKTRVRTSCTIVGGDSGGPLFDLDHKLVGIHSRIGWSLTENVHVPTDAFVSEWDKLAAGDVIDDPTARKPKLSKAILGVQFDEATKAPKIDSVTEEYPAEKAGMKAGDLIKKFDGKVVATADEVREIIARKKPGDTVDVEADRQGKTMKFKVTLIARVPEKP